MKEDRFALPDPLCPTRIALERNNYYRLERALSILHMNPGSTLADMDISTTAPLAYDFRPFFLHRPRLELYDRIALRIEQMVCVCVCCDKFLHGVRHLLVSFR